MSRRHDAALAIFIGACALLGAGVGFGIKDSLAQSAPRPTRGGASSGPMWSRGFATDGGVTSASMQTDTATVGELDAGTAWVGDLNVTGRATLKNLDVMGPSNFAPRPGGIFLPARLTRAAGLLVTTLGRWVSIGTVPGSGALSGDACDMTAWPASLAILDVDYRCFVTPSGVVDFQMKAGVALTVPAGIYQAVISGPVPAQ